MDRLESQIAEWRAYVGKAPAVNGHDLDELEGHLRDQIAELDAAGLTADEAFLVAVKRMGDIDTLSREFAREHSGRLWKQLVLSGEDEPASSASGWVEALVFAVAAAVTVQVARLAAGFPDEEPSWLARNATLFVLPFLAGYFARRRQLDTRRLALLGTPFVLGELVVNLYPYGEDSATDALVALHLPVVLWFAVAYPYMAGTLRSHQRRMGAVLGGGGCGDRGDVVRRVEAAGRGEQGAGAHDALHAALRGDAGLRRRRLRGHRARRRVRPRSPRRLRRPAARRPRARPVRHVRARPVHVAGMDGPHPAGRGRQRPRARRDGARRDDRSDRRARVHPEPSGSARTQPRPPREPGRRRLALRAISYRPQQAPPARALADHLPSRLRPVGRRGRGRPPTGVRLRLADSHQPAADGSASLVLPITRSAAA